MIWSLLKHTHSWLCVCVCVEDCEGWWQQMTAVYSGWCILSLNLQQLTDRGCRYESTWMPVCVAHLSIKAMSCSSEGPRCWLTPPAISEWLLETLCRSIKKKEIYLTSAAPRHERSQHVRLQGAASDFIRNHIKEKSKLFPADARPKATAQPQSHDCHRMKRNLHLSQLGRKLAATLFSCYNKCSRIRSWTVRLSV